MANLLDPEQIDLARLVRVVALHCGPHLSADMLGRTQFRDEVVRQLGCSELLAEELVDTLISRGFLVQAEQADGEPSWTVAPEYLHAPT